MDDLIKWGLLVIIVVQLVICGLLIGIKGDIAKLQGVADEIVFPADYGGVDVEEGEDY